MAFSVPEFPLLCDIFTGANGGFPPAGFLNPARVLSVPCQLCARSRFNLGVSAFTTYGAGFPFHTMQLLLPAGTDIRGHEGSTQKADFVTVPRLTTRLYWVLWVDDVAKGFPNEYRVALLQAVPSSWVAPYP